MGESKWEKEGRKRSPSCKEVDCWKRCINNEANRAGNDYDQQQKKIRDYWWWWHIEKTL